MDTRYLMLMDGTELIVDCEKIDGRYKFQRPIKMVLTSQGHAPMPFFGFAKSDTFFFPAELVIVDVEPEEKFVQMYREQFGSGVVTPPEKKLITL